MLKQTITGSDYRRLVISAAASVEIHKQQLNELNVFPVPDGDTGTNMSMTINAAAADLRKTEDPSLEKASGVTASAMLRGARGNSGVILSLLFRGISKQLKGVEECDGYMWAKALQAGGCEKPVIINSGSGNQGITASVPVVIYAEELGAGEEKLLRALAVSNLVTLRLKSGIGPLSAYCGAISAGCGAAAGITYLYGGGYREIAHTIVNALAINSGVVCDGAKASCAAKIASAVEAGILGMEMFQHGSQFVGGDGIVTKGVENTIENVSRLASRGMRKTDSEIIRIMLSQ